MTAKDAMTKFEELLLKGDIPKWLELFTDDAVLEYPFPPPGYPQQVIGRAALTGRFKDFAQMIEFFEFTDKQMYQTSDPDVLIAEFSCRGRVIFTNKPYNQRYIGVVRMRDGKIAHYRDYWNPLIAMEAMKESE